MICTEKEVKTLEFYSLAKFKLQFFLAPNWQIWPKYIWKDSYRVVNVQQLRTQDLLHLQDKSGELFVTQPWNFYSLAKTSFNFLWPQTGKSDLKIWKDSYRVVNVQHLRTQDLLHLQDTSGELFVTQPYSSHKLNPY